MRCMPCSRFYFALNNCVRKYKHLQYIYGKIFKQNHVTRRAFIVRSHKVPDGEKKAWILKELQAMWSEHNSLKDKTDHDPLQTTDTLLIHSNMDAATFHDKYTGADMNPVATFTQEYPLLSHCHPDMYNLSPHLVPPHRDLIRCATS